MYEKLLRRGQQHDPVVYAGMLSRMCAGNEVLVRNKNGEYQIGLRRIDKREAIISARLQRIIDNPSRRELDFLYSLVAIT